MDDNLLAILISSVISVIFIILAIILLQGKGAFLISGYNTMSKEEQNKYDTPKLCKFMGKIMIIVALYPIAITIGGIYSINWLIAVSTIVLLASIVFMLVYINTKNRFKK